MHAPAAHREFLARAQVALQSDSRIIGLLLNGSLAHGGADQNSDVDLILVCDDGAYAEVMGSRESIAGSLGELVSCFSGEHVGEPRLLICLYSQPLLHVDLKFVVAEDLSSGVEHPVLLWEREASQLAVITARSVVSWPNREPQWFEDRAWVWLHYGITKLRRGELWEALTMLGFFREQVLGLMLQRRSGRDQRGLRRVEQEGLDPGNRLVSTLAIHDDSSVHAALVASVELYLDLRNDDPPAELAEGMPQRLMEWWDK